MKLLHDHNGDEIKEEGNKHAQSYGQQLSTFIFSTDVFVFGTNKSLHAN